MKKFLVLLFLFVLGISVSGCVTVKKVVRDRVDQNLDGNQGFVKCEADKFTKITEDLRPTTREYIDIQVELPTWQEVKQAVEKDPYYVGQIANKESKNNYAKHKKSSNEKSPSQNNVMPVTGIERSNMKVVLQNESADSIIPVVIDDQSDSSSLQKKPETKESPKPTTYKVKDGDSLTKIAQECYGKAYKWTIIYDANVEKIKNPDKLNVGTVLTIPVIKDEEFFENELENDEIK